MQHNQEARGCQTKQCWLVLGLAPVGRRLKVGNIWFTFFEVPADSQVCQVKHWNTLYNTRLWWTAPPLSNDLVYPSARFSAAQKGVNSESSCTGERGQSPESDPRKRSAANSWSTKQRVTLKAHASSKHSNTLRAHTSSKLKRVLL